MIFKHSGFASSLYRYTKQTSIIIRIISIKVLLVLKGRRGIEPKTGFNPFLKTALNVFCIYIIDFFS